MKVFIIDEDRIVKYKLPFKVDEYFLISYKDFNGNKDYTITIEAEDGKWKLKSNGNFNIVNGKNIEDEAVLIDYSYYFLKAIGNDKIVKVFVLPTQEKELYKLSYKGITRITIGNSPNTNIFYKQNSIGENCAEIRLEQDYWVINALTEPNCIYVNDIKKSYSKLNYGDIIFIDGLKVIWMKDFLEINNPNRLVFVKGLSPSPTLNQIDNKNCKLVSEEENNFDLYNEDDYFYHIARIQEKWEEEEVIIDAPPGNQLGDEIPVLLTLGTSLTMMGSSFVLGYNLYDNLSTGKRTWQECIPQIIMLFAMFVGSIIMPRILNSYGKRKRKAKESLRQKKYHTYLDGKKAKIDLILKHQTDILNDNNDFITKCIDYVSTRSQKLFSREIPDADFLTVRLGLGQRESKIKIVAPNEQFTLDEDNLFNEVYKIVDDAKYLKNVPITFSFAENNVSSFVFNCPYKRDYINGVITQLVTFQSPVDLKIIILTNEKNCDFWSFTNSLPHCWSDDKSIRFFGSKNEDFNNISTYLEDELKKRKEQETTNEEQTKGDEKLTAEEKKRKNYIKYEPYYLIITDNYKKVKNLPIVINLLKEKSNFGFSFLTIADMMKDLPNKCEVFVEIGIKNSCILNKEISSQSKVLFSNEYVPDLDMKQLSEKLANIPFAAKDGVTSLPTSLTFLDMFNVSKIEQLNIANRWHVNSPVSTLSTEVGVHSNLEPFKLDLHEKYHGPHGLIAGSTGSGKSEFIITYILSMAVNYHPYEVQFVLIDYKGGGLAGAFENKETGVRIPHLVGTITNLDTSEINRTLVSIDSELKRRQRIFNETRDALGEGTIDIYKYQKLYREGVVKEPLAHLFIISDEFAELKSQLPDFMAQLISTARIGRSLGVHLILATQKPTGVVNDQIWSNSKFKICFKVQNRSDSMEMLKRPDAASIKEVGRFFLQVGYDDYFDVGQSGWCGAKYVPTNKKSKKIDDSINFVDNVGNVIKSVNDVIKVDSTINLGEQVTNVVKYLYELSKKDQVMTKRMWLDKIPGVIYIENLKKKYSYIPKSYFINPLIGEYDNPKEQEQGLLNLDLTVGGNTIIYGQSGSGKENLISTIVWSSMTEHTPEEVNIYIIDCGAETLKMYKKFPHIGEVTTIDDSNKIVEIFNMILEELEQRKTLFADYMGNYVNFCENSSKKMPFIEVIINGYENFCEVFSKLSEDVQPIYRDCSKYGIVFIISASNSASIRSRMLQNFGNRISLQLQDDSDYRTVLGCPRELIPFKVFGRGIIEKEKEFFEFQTASICDFKQLGNTIEVVSTKLNSFYSTRAKKIAVVPDKITFELVSNYITDLTKIPIGFSIETKEVFSYNFFKNKINLILSNDMEEKMNFIYALVRELKLINNINVSILDFVKGFKKEFEGVLKIDSNLDEAFANISASLRNDKQSKENNVYILIGPGNMRNILNDTGIKIVNNIFTSISMIDNSTFILVDDYENSKRMKSEVWYQSQVDTSYGIWLGEGIGSQMAINTLNLTMEDRKADFSYMAYVINQGKHTLIKGVIDEVEGNNEE